MPLENNSSINHVLLHPIINFNTYKISEKNLQGLYEFSDKKPAQK